MKLADTLPVTGQLKIFKTKGHMPDVDKDTPIYEENLVVTTGKQWIAQRMGGGAAVSPAPKDMSHMALGQGTIAETVDDTTLVAELHRTGMAAVTVTGNQVVYTATFKEDEATGAITEAGIFDASVNGIMLSRSVFPVVNKQIDDYMTVLWVITVG